MSNQKKRSPKHKPLRTAKQYARFAKEFQELEAAVRKAFYTRLELGPNEVTILGISFDNLHACVQYRLHSSSRPYETDKTYFSTYAFLSTEPPTPRPPVRRPHTPCGCAIRGRPAEYGGSCEHDF